MIERPSGRNQARMVRSDDATGDSSLTDLHRRYDGAPPREALRVATLGGAVNANALRRAAALTLNERLAADARLATARRRAALPARACLRDAWLARLCATLAHHRDAAIRLRLDAPAPQQADQRKAYSQ